VDKSILNVSKTLQAAYEEQYTDSITEWRELGGKYKAANILDVCRNYKFINVLECGAGEGSILKFLDASGIFPNLYAVEISDSAVSQILKRNLPKLIEVKKFDGYNIPYSDKEFDMAYCSHVIEHVEHPRLLIRELKRVSKFQVFEIPLDYDINVDQYVKYFLSYGHINIYTPSVFKFLLKSEGYEIITELLTHQDNEVVRYSWYKNLNLKKTFRKELSLKLNPLFKFWRQKRLGNDSYKEYGYEAYTCLAKGTGDLKIF
jgi:ubiquinone/menaquinone biosynthesis C-methylase UbiE